MKKIQWKKTALRLAVTLVSGTFLLSGTALAEEKSASEQYQMILNSQGNLSDTAVSSSDRYLLTSAIRIVVDEENNSGEKSSSSGSSSTSRSSTSSASSGSGPASEGAKADIREDTESIGPTVTAVSLSETYHEEYEIYEISMQNRYFVYSTVSNGGITDQAVRIEIPANVQYAMKFNGVDIPYASGQPVSSRGSYTLELSAVEDASLPASEQTVYKASMRFRIQEKAVTEEERLPGSQYAPSDSLDTHLESDVLPDLGDRIDLSEVAALAGFENAQLSIDRETLDRILQSDGTGSYLGIPYSDIISYLGGGTSGSGEGTPGDGEESFSGLISEDGTLNEDGLTAAIEEAIGLGYSAEALEGYSPATGLASGYDAETGYYKHELISGVAFYSDVPNGMVTNYSVTLLTEEEGLLFTVLKDGEAIEYVPGTPFEEVGSYMVYPYQENTIYIASYAAQEKPVFHFRILGKSVSDLGTFTAPEGASITQVLCNDTPLEKGPFFTEEWCYLEQDGQYTIELDTEAGLSSVAFRRDTLAPRFGYRVEENSLSLVYGTEDVSEVLIYLDGELVNGGNVVGSISGNGVFSIQAYDEAGNMSSASAEVPYTMNTAAILSIVLILLLIVLLIVVFRRMRGQVEMR